MSVSIVKLIDPIQFTNVAGGLVPKGAYNAGTNYGVGDSVDYNGSSYVMFNDAPAGTVPTNTTYWQVLANKGATGSTGADGATGATGAAGAAGADGMDGADGVVQSIVAGTNVTVDNTDPANPVVSASGGGGGATNLDATLSSSNTIITSDTGTDATIPAVDATNAGVMTPTQKTKLDGIATGATANSSDATLLARANHTGTQTASTISDFSTAADARITAATGVSVEAHDADLTAIAGLTPTNDDVIQRKSGAWTNRTMAQVKTDLALAKGDVGLVNVDNTSDATKNSAVASLTNKDLTSGTNTFPTLNQNTTGTAANLSGTPALPNGTTATTQSASDNSTKLATTAYVDSGLSGKQASDSGLTTIAGLTATTNNFIQSKASAWSSRTPTQVTADLIPMVGDSGAGGTKGLVPAPATGDAAAGKYLKADGTWTVPPAGGGGVSDGDKGDVVVSGTGTVYSVESAAGAFQFLGDISPSQITSDQNDYAPTGYAAAAVLKLDADQIRAITGLGGGADGKVVTIMNVSSGKDSCIILRKENTSSTAANRFAFITDVVIDVGESVQIIYDSTASRWRLTHPIPDTPAQRRMTTPFFDSDFVGAGTAGTVEVSYPWDLTLISSGTHAKQANVANHQGIVRIVSSTTTNSGGLIATQAAAYLIQGGEFAEFVIQPITLTNSTIRLGFHDCTTSSDAVDGVYVEIPSTGAAVLKTASNSTRTTSSTITTVSTSTWYRVRLEVDNAAANATAWIFDANGNQLGTATQSTNIPTGAGRDTAHGIIGTNSGTTAIGIVDLDYMSVGSSKALIR